MLALTIMVLDISESTEKMKVRALILFQEQRFSEARKLYKNLCESDADNMHAWFILGAISAKLGMFDEAIDCCQKVLTLNPAHVPALLNLAKVRMHKGNFSQTVKNYLST